MIERRFRASHALRLPDGTREPMHEHDWQVEVVVERVGLDEIDVVVDFHALQGWVDSVLAPLREAVLNDLERFASVNPSAERVAEHLYKALEPLLPAEVGLVSVTVTEAPGCRARYFGGSAGPRATVH